MDIEHASEQELINELAKRNAALVVIRMRFPKGTKQHYERIDDYFGGFATCLGMLECMAMKMKIDDVESRQRIDQPGDDDD